MRIASLLTVIVALFLAGGPAQAQPDSGAREFAIAEAYRKMGRLGGAHYYYKLTLSRFPGSKYAWKAIQRIAELPGKGG